MATTAFEAPAAAAQDALGAPAVRRRGERLRWVHALVLPAAILLLWQLATALGIYKPHQLPGPAAVAATAFDLALGGLLWQHVGTSVARVLAGFAIGATVAVALAVVVGLSRTLERVVDPTIQAIRTIPSLAWVPLLLLWMGIDEAPKVTLIAIGAAFPIYLSLVAGIRDVDRKLIEVGMMYGLRGFSLAREIVVPAALPYLLVGLRSGLGQAWLFLVAAELIAASRGLGFMLTDGQSLSRVDIVLTAIVLLAVLGKLSDGLLRVVERRLLAWRDAFGGA
jgi:sulfonate transport system permease protein